MILSSSGMDSSESLKGYFALIQQRIVGRGFKSLCSSNTNIQLIYSIANIWHQVANTYPSIFVIRNIIVVVP